AASFSRGPVANSIASSSLTAIDWRDTWSIALAGKVALRFPVSSPGRTRCRLFVTTRSRPSPPKAASQSSARAPTPMTRTPTTATRPTPIRTRLTPTAIPPTQTQTTPTPRRHATAALARCLDPVDSETFFAEYRERRPLIVRRDEPGRFDDLLSEADVEKLVCAGAIRYPAFRLVQEGRQIGLGDYVNDVSWRPPFTNTVDVPRVLEEWEAGATIVLQALHVRWHPLPVFCRALAEALENGVQANAHYTPRA